MAQLRAVLSSFSQPFQPAKRHLLLDPHRGAPGLHRVDAASSLLFRFCQQLCDTTGGSWYPQPQAVRGVELVAVDEVVHYAGQVQAFEYRLGNVQALRGSGSAHFNFDTRSFSASKLLVLQALRDRFHEKVAGNNNNPLINTTYCFHGPRREHVDSICSTGLVSVRALDAGFFGSGCYSTPNIEYAARYARGDFDSPVAAVRRPSPDGRYPVIMLAACVGMCYPITPDTDYGNTAGVPDGHSDYFGRPLRPGFDCHCVCVSDLFGMQAVPREHCQYMELVHDQQSDLLPIAVLWFESSDNHH